MQAIVSAICAHAGHELRPFRWLLHSDKPGMRGFPISQSPASAPTADSSKFCRNWSVKSCPSFWWSMRQELSRRRVLPHVTIIISIGTTNGVIQRRPGSGSPSPGGAAALHLSCRRDTLRQDLPHCPHDYDPCAPGKGFPPCHIAPSRQRGAGFHRARHASSSRAALFSRDAA